MPEKRVVLVTGAGHGLGRSMAEHLSSTGYVVVAADIDASAAEAVAAEISASGGECHARRLDVTQQASCAQTVQYAEEELGGIYGLVNNAGVGKATPFLEMTEGDWDSVFAVNSKGVFLMCRAVAPALVERGEGAIVNISSIAGKEGYPNWAHYGASKHAVIGLTRALARELGPSGVRVNAVCPGAIKTAIWSAEAQSVEDPDRVFDALAATTALRRNQSAEDVAYSVEFLLGDAARSITGQALSVDSGLILS